MTTATGRGAAPEAAPTERLGWLERLGRAQARHARSVAAAWVVIVVVGFGVAFGAFGGGSLFDRLHSGEPDVPGETQVGRQMLDAREQSGERVLVMLDGIDPTAPAVRQHVQAVEQKVRQVEGVQSVASPYSAPGGVTSTAGQAFVATDGHGLLVSVTLQPRLPSRTEQRAIDQSQQLLGTVDDGLPGASAHVGSVDQLVHDITHQVEVDLRTGEGVALPISLLVMVLVFGGFLAAGMPLAGAIASIAGALASLYGFSRVIELDATVVNVVTILGLGLCIDYGLLIVSRFREELHVLDTGRAGPAGSESLPESGRRAVELALGRTVAHAGRTVLFSALIVGISLSGLLLFQTTILRALGAAGVSAVVVALLVALTFVPAMIGLAGHRLLRPGLPMRVPGVRSLLRRLGDVAPSQGVFSRLALRVQRHPWIVALVVVAALIGLAAPALSLRMTSSGTALLPKGADQRTFFEQLDARYPALADPDVTVVARADLAQVQAWSRDVTTVPGVASTVPPEQLEGLVVLGIQVVGDDPTGQTATTVVEHLRSHRPTFPIWVVGQAAGELDYSHAIRARAPLAGGLVVLATFVLLFLMTGSVLVPLKALLMNVVSLGASLGVLVLIFQDGNLEKLLGFTSTGAIESTIPPLVLAFGFGLAMDYEVFLLSRIKEEHDHGRDNDSSVVHGLQRSGRIITSAALLVVIVFTGLIAGKLLVVKQTGVALATAVAIDATLVRMLLVPATMTLLGEWNWWAPAPLRRLHARFGVTEH
ncbi:MAG TPA: MMPL family transporter [Actinomycetales bacterium]|nr:MMPL family transporter [Actinomycetales bacterium]